MGWSPTFQQERPSKRWTLYFSEGESAKKVPQPFLKNRGPPLLHGFKGKPFRDNARLEPRLGSDQVLSAHSVICTWTSHLASRRNIDHILLGGALPVDKAWLPKGIRFATDFTHFVISNGFAQLKLPLAKGSGTPRATLGFHGTSLPGAPVQTRRAPVDFMKPMVGCRFCGLHVKRPRNDPCIAAIPIDRIWTWVVSVVSCTGFPSKARKRLANPKGGKRRSHGRCALPPRGVPFLFAVGLNPHFREDPKPPKLRFSFPGLFHRSQRVGGSLPHSSTL